jgi:hypothetical protein
VTYIERKLLYLAAELGQLSLPGLKLALIQRISVCLKLIATKLA